MSDLQTTAEQAWKAKVPLLHRLSEGTCWLVSVPYPSHVDAPAGRHWYHMMFDSWIWGEIGILGGWAVGQKFTVPPTYTSFDQVEDLCRQIEAVSHGIDGTPKPDSAPAPLDAVMICHSNIDHFVPHVLREIPATTPVFVSSIVAGHVKGLKHFEHVYTFGTHDPADWKACQVEGMPSWFSFGLLDSPDYGHQFPAVIFAFEAEKREVKAIIYAIHGIEAQELAPIAEHGQFEVLALMAVMSDVKFAYLGMQVGHSGVKALACVRAIKPRYWIRNHDDEHVQTYGLAGKILMKDVYDLDRALEETKAAGHEQGLGDTKYADKRAGETIALV